MCVSVTLVLDSESQVDNSEAGHESIHHLLGLGGFVCVFLISH